MLPYIDLPEAHLGPLTIHWFGLLVALGVIVGTALAGRRARQLGIDRVVLDSFIWWVLVFGFVGAHVLDTLFYYPAEVLRRPWALLFLWEGLSSFGGFIGALVGALAWRARRRRPILPLVDVVLSVFPIAWVFGRAGCAVVHDHPGVLTSPGNPLAVAFPGGARYDLGLLELLFAVVLSAVVVATWRRRLATGAYVVINAVAYAPVRFGLDFLRAPEAAGGDPRILGLTPAQWACIPLFLFGLWMWARIAGRPGATEMPAGASRKEGGFGGRGASLPPR